MHSFCRKLTYGPESLALRIEPGAPLQDLRGDENLMVSKVSSVSAMLLEVLWLYVYAYTHRRQRVTHGRYIGSCTSLSF